MITSIHIEYQTAGRWLAVIEDHKGRFSYEVRDLPWTGAMCGLAASIADMVKERGIIIDGDGHD